ncbi:hypothetical protein OA93_04565 [Flavobacterium sp. KMS]|uniref:hypothetical protein n=1 Tax=Flavobacterium sp. KMS TaxID=1566023 RepID=UPI0005803F79|nr:hypothetical protein [Flavobacterium sp. KMS]KIA99444.1 hypothetical protein OA93_04565 [Flavobacterium sp. KMS]
MSKINASKFLFSFDYKERDLKFILNSVYKCYLKIMISNILVNNNENDIRDIFISDEYLDNYALKKELDIVEFKFDKEIQTETGRVDIRVLNMVKTMKGDFNPYYFIECKRIKGDKTYNDYYIDNGISRFIDEKYHTYQEANAMMGFVVKQIDVKTNSSYFSDLSYHNFIDDYEYTYVSSHLTKSNKKITLYHLMLDFSSKINGSKN